MEEKSKIIPPKYILPSDNNEQLSFVRKHKLNLMEQVVTSIEIGITNDLMGVEVFQFENSDFVITVASKDYLSNLDNIYEYYMKKEAYEYCPRVVKLQKTLKEKSVKPTNEKQISFPRK